MDQIVGEIDILRIAFEAHAPSLLVRIGVVAHLVPGVENALVEVGIHLDVLAQHEEGRFGIVLVQRRKNPLRDARRGTVVEGQEHAVLVVDLPDQRREQVTDYFGRLEFHDEKKYSGGVRHRQR